MDRLHAMSVFVAVADSGSLSAAGRKLRMPLPTVSRKVSDLEAHLKVKLLHRSTRAARLTAAGDTYLASAREVLDKVNEAEKSAVGENAAPAGELAITAPIVFGRLQVLPVVTDFLRAHPDMRVRLLLGDGTLSLIEDPIDLAVRIGELPDRNLVATRVGVTRVVTCASPAYLRAHGRPSAPRDLLEHACVCFTGMDRSGNWSFFSGGRTVTVPVKPRLSVNTAEAAVEAVTAGLGVGRLMAYQVDAARRAGKLKTILDGFNAPPLPISLVYLPQPSLPLKLRAFLDFAAPRLRKSIAATG